MIGMKGKKTNYITIPYHAICHCAIRTAGGDTNLGIMTVGDRDCELMLWLPCHWQRMVKKRVKDDHGDGHHEEKEPPLPLHAYFELDFAKDKVDLVGLHRYVSEKLCYAGGNRFGPSNYKPATPGAIRNPTMEIDSNRSSFFDWFTRNASEIDGEAMAKQLKEVGIMFPDEKPGPTFKEGKDVLMLTNLRILVIDSKSFLGLNVAKKTVYITVPWSSVRATAITTAGGWFDGDAEIKFNVRGTWCANPSKADVCSSDSDCEKSYVDIDVKSKVNLFKVMEYFLNVAIIQIWRGERCNFCPIVICTCGIIRVHPIFL